MLSSGESLPRPSTEPASLGLKSATLSTEWCYEYGLKPEDPTGCNTSVSSDSESDDESQHAQEQYFAVSALHQCIAQVELDVVWGRCRALRKHMRQVPCLPIQVDGSLMTVADVSFGTKLPIYSCPYQKSRFHCDDRCRFLHHVAGGSSNSAHTGRCWTAF